MEPINQSELILLPKGQQRVWRVEEEDLILSYVEEHHRDENPRSHKCAMRLIRDASAFIANDLGNDEISPLDCLRKVAEFSGQYSDFKHFLTLLGVKHFEEVNLLVTSPAYYKHLDQEEDGVEPEVYRRFRMKGEPRFIVFDALFGISGTSG